MVHGPPSRHSGAREISNGNPERTGTTMAAMGKKFYSVVHSVIITTDASTFDGRIISLDFFLNIGKRCAHLSGPAKPRKPSAQRCGGLAEDLDTFVAIWTDIIVQWGARGVLFVPVHRHLMQDYASHVDVVFSATSHLLRIEVMIGCNEKLKLLTL